MDRISIISGPASCGNISRTYTSFLIPDGLFALVRRGAYTNLPGTFGPCLIDGTFYKSRRAAENARKKLERETNR